MRATVVGAGVAGLTTAVALAERGAKVTLIERSRELGGNASWLAGGMLAPFCEGESAPPSRRRTRAACNRMVGRARSWRRAHRHAGRRAAARRGRDRTIRRAHVGPRARRRTAHRRARAGPRRALPQGTVLRPRRPSRSARRDARACGVAAPTWRRDALRRGRRDARPWGGNNCRLPGLRGAPRTAATCAACAAR